MATPRTVEVRVSAKRSKDYNSREYAYGVTLDLDKTDDPTTVMAEWTARLKDTIREQMSGAPKNGESA